jgi:hypothetical protein
MDEIEMSLQHRSQSILEPEPESTERTQKLAGLDVSQQAQWFSWYPERTKC